MRLAILLILVCVQPAFGWLEYDETRRVPFASFANHQRDEYDWWICNTGEPSKLYYNGVFQEQEAGTWGIDMPSAWAIQPSANGVKVGVVDIDNIHGQMICELVTKTAPGATVLLFSVLRYYPDVIAPAIVAAANNGCRVIVVPTGWNIDEPTSKAACVYAGQRNCIIVCSTINAPGSYDVTPDYPSSWYLPNVQPVCGVDRNGNLYWSSTGAGCVSAPSRNITAAGVYSSGTSYAAPIVGGTLALMIARKPKANNTTYLNALRLSGDYREGAFRINPAAALVAIKPPLAILGPVTQ